MPRIAGETPAYALPASVCELRKAGRATADRPALLLFRRRRRLGLQADADHLELAVDDVPVDKKDFLAAGW